MGCMCTRNGPKPPVLSIVMSVYNAQRFLKEAIESILDQSFEDLEFIIVNDASKDNTLRIIESCDDRRIRIMNNSKNLGLTRSLNKAIKVAKGRYIARMDADDISLPQRFEKQISVLQGNTAISVVSSWVDVIDENGDILVVRRIPPWKVCKKLLRYENLITHGGVVVRRDAFHNHGYYDENLRYGQDRELWQRFIDAGVGFYIIEESLYQFRISGVNISVVEKKNLSSLPGNENKRKEERDFWIASILLQEGKSKEARKRLWQLKTSPKGFIYILVSLLPMKFQKLFMFNLRYKLQFFCKTSLKICR